LPYLPVLWPGRCRARCQNIVLALWSCVQWRNLEDSCESSTNAARSVLGPQRSFPKENVPDFSPKSVEQNPVNGEKKSFCILLNPNTSPASYSTRFSAVPLLRAASSDFLVHVLLINAVGHWVLFPQPQVLPPQAPGTRAYMRFRPPAAQTT
jgi:hypothetical protein